MKDAKIVKRLKSVRSKLQDEKDHLLMKQYFEAGRTFEQEASIGKITEAKFMYCFYGFVAGIVLSAAIVVVQLW